MSRPVFTIVFLTVLYLAKASIIDLATANGLKDAIVKDLEAEPIHFTSVKQLDSLLTMPVRFFQPIVSGKDLPLTLFSIFMASQLLAVHILIIVEGLRFGNRGKIISCTTAWGMLWQLITIGVTLPLYFLTWIWTSGIPDAASPTAYAEAISVHPAEGEAVLSSWTLGTLLPSVALGLPSPSLISQHAQEVALAVWQNFPLWTGIFQAILSKVASVPQASREKQETKIARFQKIYTYTLALTAVCHYGLVSYVYMRAETAAGVSPLELLVQILRPTWPWDTKPMASLEKGALALLQWDMYCASLATWIWIAYMAYAKVGVGRVVADLGKAVMWSCVVGPGGAALAVVWGRDVEAIRAAGGENSSGKK